MRDFDEAVVILFSVELDSIEAGGELVDGKVLLQQAMADVVDRRVDLLQRASAVRTVSSDRVCYAVRLTDARRFLLPLASATFRFVIASRSSASTSRLRMRCRRFVVSLEHCDDEGSARTSQVRRIFA